MEINLESAEENSIQSYDEKSITINGLQYTSSILVSRDTIETNWPIQHVTELSIENVNQLLNINPEIIIIGHQELDSQIPLPVLSFLSQKQIGMECMHIGAACRTFNVLLAEQRNALLGIIKK